MMRFKVIKGGTIILIAACVILAVVIALIAVSMVSDSREAAETTASSAVVSAFVPSDGIIFDPKYQPGENEHTDETVSEDIVSESIPVSNGKRVLIYHTHTHEAYDMEYEGEYEALEPWRTDDNEHNVVRVGSELAQLLRDRGFEVVHDTTDNEQTELSTAYQRSLVTLSSYADRAFDLYIDLHRDAYSDGAQLTCSYGGSEAARLMVLIGKGENFTNKPYFEENYALAQDITEAVNAICPGLCRDVLVKTGRYNQHIAPDSILIEAGSNMNTLNQVLASMPVLADAIADVYTDGDGIVTVSSPGR